VSDDCVEVGASRLARALNSVGVCVGLGSRRTLKGGHDARESQRKSVLARRANKEARIRALADASGSASTEALGEVERTPTRGGTPRLPERLQIKLVVAEPAHGKVFHQPELEPRLATERARAAWRLEYEISPQEFDSRRGRVHQRPVRRSAKWFDQSSSNDSRFRF
jgi:hypothetical protein